MVGQDVDRIAFADGGGFDGAFLRIRRRELGLGMDAVCPEEADVEVEPADEVQGIRTDEGVRGKLQLTPGDIADKPSLDELLAFLDELGGLTGDELLDVRLRSLPLQVFFVESFELEVSREMKRSGSAMDAEDFMLVCHPLEIPADGGLGRFEILGQRFDRDELRWAFFEEFENFLVSFF